MNERPVPAGTLDLKITSAALRTVIEIIDLAPALRALAKRLPPEDAEVIARVLQALPDVTNRESAR